MKHGFVSAASIFTRSSAAAIAPAPAFVGSLATPEGERLVILRPSEIPQRLFFAASDRRGSAT